MTNYVAMDVYIMGSVSDKIYDLKQEKQMMTAGFLGAKMLKLRLLFISIKLGKLILACRKI